MGRSTHVRVATLVLMVLGAVTLGGCGGQRDGHSGTGTTVAQTAPEGGGSSAGGGAAAPSLGKAHNAIIAAACSGGGLDPEAYTLTAISPTGEPTATVTISLPDGVEGTYGCGDGSYAFRQMFDKDYSRMAVTIHDSDNNSDHVGYYDLTSQQVVDLDANSGSSFAAAPQNHNPVFSPTTGDLWYVSGPIDNHQILRRPADGGQAIDTGQHFRYYGETKFVVAADRIVPTDGDNGGLPDPSGRFLASYSSTASSSQNKFNIKRDPYDEGAVAEVPDDYPKELRGPLAWVDRRRVLAYVDQSTMDNPRRNNFALITLSPDLKKVEGGRLLLPNSDRDNASPVVSPDHRTVAFLSGRGSKAGLYMTSIEGTSQPRQVQTTAVASLLVEWR